MRITKKHASSPLQIGMNAHCIGQRKQTSVCLADKLNNGRHLKWTIRSAAGI